MEFQHAMFTRNGVRNLKEIKRGNQSKKAENTEEGGGEQSQRKPAPALAPPLTRTQARDPNPRRGGRAGRRRTAATGQAQRGARAHITPRHPRIHRSLNACARVTRADLK